MSERHRYIPYSPEQRQTLRDDVFAKLEAGVASIQNSESFARYLSVQAKFHHYSAHNVALILAQRPEATAVASFRRWNQDFDRHVKKGEHAIRILAPTFGTDAETGESVVRGFIPVPVFDLAQTEGRPLPEPELPRLLEGEEGAQLFDALLDYTRRSSIQVRLARSGLELGGANGDYNPRSRQIRLRPNPMRQLAKTLAHELAHHVHLSVLGAESAERGERETVAEGAAFVVMHHFGLDSGQYTFPYVAVWSRDRDRLVRQLDVIHQVSLQLIDALAGTPEDRLQPQEESSALLRQPAPSTDNTF